jgi:hypothetical protein
LSHIVQIQTEVRDRMAIEAACRRLGLGAATEGTFQLYSQQATGLGVKLPGWSYPVVCDTATGQVQYDNFSGYWGEQKELDKFLQAYAVEKAKLEARKRGFSVTESQRADGHIVVTIGAPENTTNASPSMWDRFRSMFGGSRN